MTQGRIFLIALATLFLGVGLAGMFPHGTLIVGSLSWDYLGGMLAGLSIGIIRGTPGRGRQDGRA